MLKQYCILSKCLSELKKSDLPLIEKLKLEVQLIQTKRILLDYKVEQRVTGALGSEKEFNDLYEQFRHVCNSGDVVGEVARLKAQIHEIKDGLSAVPAGKLFIPPQVADNLRSQAAVRKAPASVKDIFK